jgi:hypothetical protein
MQIVVQEISDLQTLERIARRAGDVLGEPVEPLDSPLMPFDEMSQDDETPNRQATPAKDAPSAEAVAKPAKAALVSQSAALAATSTANPRMARRQRRAEQRLAARNAKRSALLGEGPDRHETLRGSNPAWLANLMASNSPQPPQIRPPAVNYS